MPWSISSKIKVGTKSACASTFLSASIRREVSPPEAIFTSGFSPSPGLGAMRNSTRSKPVASKATRLPSSRLSPCGSASLLELDRETRPGHAQVIQLAFHALFQAGRGGFALRGKLASQFGSSSSRPPSFSSSSAMRSVACAMVSSSWRAFSAKARTASIEPPYLRCSLWSQVQAFLRLLQAAGVELDPFQVIAQFAAPDRRPDRTIVAACSASVLRWHRCG